MQTAKELDRKCEKCPAMALSFKALCAECYYDENDYFTLSGCVEDIWTLINTLTASTNLDAEQKNIIDQFADCVKDYGIFYERKSA